MSGHTVLVVEDEEDLRDMMCEALEANGFTVVAAKEGNEALAALSRIDHVCLILLDLMMPGMNGWDFFELVRAKPNMASIPIVIHSSVPDRAPDGVTRVIKKPLELERLLSIVREYC